MDKGRVKAETGVDNVSSVGAEGYFITSDGSVQMEDSLRMNAQRIVSLQDPVDPQDAATKAYVDAVVGSGDTKRALVSATDTTEGYLRDKIVDGTNVTTSIINPGANEQIRFDAAGGGGGATLRDYIASVDKSVPDQGTQALFLGKVSSFSAPAKISKASTIIGMSVVVDTADPANAYNLEIIRSGFPIATLPLPATQTEATGVVSVAVLAGDNLSFRMSRTSGSGRSAFNNVTAMIEIEET